MSWKIVIKINFSKSERKTFLRLSADYAAAGWIIMNAYWWYEHDDDACTNIDGQFYLYIQRDDNFF